MRWMISLLAACGALCGGTAQAASVEIKDAVAQVTVVPENRADVKVEVVQTNPRLPLRLRTMFGRTIVDGDLRMNRIRNCRGSGDATVVRVAGVGDISAREMPRLVIHTPRNVDLTAGGAVYGSIGRAANVTLANAGCGDWSVANVDDLLKVNVAGSGNLRAGTAGQGQLRVAGSGDLRATDMRGRLDVDVAGSGNVTVASVSGPLRVHVAGSGDVKVAGGHAPAMTVSVAGSGNVNFRGVADSLEARIAGSGDVRAREVRGRVSKSVIGSGGVFVG